MHDLSLSTEDSVSTIYSWIKTFVGVVTVTGLHKTIKGQEKKISWLENMITIIQNADFFKNVSLSERFKVLTLHVMLWMLHVVLSIIIKNEVMAKNICTKNAREYYCLRFKR